MSTWQEYRNKYQDVQTWINDARKQGINQGTGEYSTKYGVNTSGWEGEWVRRANEQYNRNSSDAGEYSEDELSRLHYDNWGKGEGRDWSGKTDYDKDAQYRNQEKQSSDFDLGKFETLLGRLEESKGRQQRQKSVEGRRDIFAGGLAGMMNNF